VDPPFAIVPREHRRGAIWVEPRLVVELEFATWTSDGILRHASFEGLREDSISHPSRERQTP
jgi:bifunctional non-homologous end joining protein LigD